jgi:hypothetical protein
MGEQPGDFFNADNDESLQKQFEAIDALPEHEARMCCKAAYSNLKTAHILYNQLIEVFDKTISEYRLKIEALERKIERRKHKIREIFDL